MHIQIINFNLKDVSEEDYRNLCDQLAPKFADLPGLVSKAWLADSASNTYGGVYVWQDRESMVDFTKTDLFKKNRLNRLSSPRSINTARLHVQLLPLQRDGDFDASSWLYPFQVMLVKVWRGAMILAEANQIRLNPAPHTRRRRRLREPRREAVTSTGPETLALSKVVETRP